MKYTKGVFLHQKVSVFLDVNLATNFLQMSYLVDAYKHRLLFQLIPVISSKLRANNLVTVPYKRYVPVHINYLNTIIDS